MNTNCCSTNACECSPASATVQDTAKTPTYLPSVDVHETPDAIVITADIPGVRPESVDVTFEDTTLTIRANVSPRAEAGSSPSRRAIHREYGVGNYIRRFNITDPIDRDRMNAGLADGVLTLTLPKSEAARPRKIPVQAASNN